MWAIAMHNYTLLNNNFKKNQKLQWEREIWTLNIFLRNIEYFEL